MEFCVGRKWAFQHPGEKRRRLKRGRTQKSHDYVFSHLRGNFSKNRTFLEIENNN